MLDNTLTELEEAIRGLLQRNAALSARNQELEVALQAARQDNDTLQLSLMEQEEAGAGARQRLESLLSLVATPQDATPA